MKTIKALPIAFALAACSSPEPNIYTLVPEPGAAGITAFRNIEIRRPGLAGYLDRSDVVLKLSHYQLSTNSQQRWAAPLSEMIGRVLASNLSQRLPGSSVYTDEGAISADPDARVEVDIRRFDPDASGAVVLEAAYAVEQGSGHQPLAARDIRLIANSAGAGAGAPAAAMSGLLGQLSDQIAAAMRQPLISVR